MKNLLFSMIFALAILLQISPADSEGVEADLSIHHVAVKTDFAGVKVQLFGAIVNPGNIKNLALLDMIIVVRGPKREMHIRKEERVADLWINRQSATFEDVPGYYAVISSRPVSEIAETYTLLENSIISVILALAVGMGAASLFRKA